MLLRICDLDPDRHTLEKCVGAKIGADVEHDLVGAGAQALALEQRRVGSAIGIGARLGELGTVGAVEFDTDAGAWLAACRVEHVCGQSAHHLSPKNLPSRPRAMWPICSSALRSSSSALLPRRRSISASTLAREACSRNATI